MAIPEKSGVAFFILGKEKRKMRVLTISEIERLASRPRVRKTNVENFLATMGDYGELAARANLKRDGKMYQWSPATVAALEDGIRMATDENRKI